MDSNWETLTATTRRIWGNEKVDKVDLEDVTYVYRQDNEIYVHSYDGESKRPSVFHVSFSLYPKKTKRIAALLEEFMAPYRSGSSVSTGYEEAGGIKALPEEVVERMFCDSRVPIQEDRVREQEKNRAVSSSGVGGDQEVRTRLLRLESYYNNLEIIHKMTQVVLYIPVLFGLYRSRLTIFSFQEFFDQQPGLIGDVVHGSLCLILNWFMASSLSRNERKGKVFVYEATRAGVLEKQRPIRRMLAARRTETV